MLTAAQVVRVTTGFAAVLAAAEEL